MDRFPGKVKKTPSFTGSIVGEGIENTGEKRFLCGSVVVVWCTTRRSAHAYLCGMVWVVGAEFYHFLSPVNS